MEPADVRGALPIEAPAAPGAGAAGARTSTGSLPYGRPPPSEGSPPAG